MIVAFMKIRAKYESTARKYFNVSVEFLFFFSSRRRHTRFDCDWSSDVCSSDLKISELNKGRLTARTAEINTNRKQERYNERSAFNFFDKRHAEEGQRESNQQLDQIGRASCRERV